VADYLKIKQDTVVKILAVTIPLFVVSYFLTLIDFNLLWRYFNWANQVTAVIALLISTRYLYLKNRNYWVTLIPGVFILYAVVVYILSEPIGLHMGLTPVTYVAGAVITLGFLWLFWESGKKQKENLDYSSPLLNDHLPIETNPAN
jgi:Carbon starvation protein, predicted membrane protein